MYSRVGSGRPHGVGRGQRSWAVRHASLGALFTVMVVAMWQGYIGPKGREGVQQSYEGGEAAASAAAAAPSSHDSPFVQLTNVEKKSQGPASVARSEARYTEQDLLAAFDKGRQNVLKETARAAKAKVLKSPGETANDDSRDATAGEQEAALCPTTRKHRGRRQPGECIGARGPVWEEKGYNLSPFEDMFYPFDPSTTSFKSLVVFGSGRKDMVHIDALVRHWGMEHFDYVLMHYDDSSSEWNKFDWYKSVVSVTAQRQAKLWFYKRFATPWHVKGYRYVHFVDSDVGSPKEWPFDLAEYDSFLHEHKIMMGQPATSLKGRSSTVPVARVHEDTLFRWTAFVENLFYSVAQEAYECYWEMINPEYVSGWGVDAAWCPYLSEVCGFPKEATCAVVDVHYIDHLNSQTASGLTFRDGKSYNDFGVAEWGGYDAHLFQSGLLSPPKAWAEQLETQGRVLLPEGWKPKAAGNGQTDAKDGITTSAQ